MKSILVLVLLVAALVIGCGKHDSPALQAVPPPSEAAGTPPANPSVDPAASAPGTAPKQAAARAIATPGAAPANNSAALEGAVHVMMTTQLRKFIQENGRLPGDFSEFASARMDSVPFPPDGMKYVIDYATMEVKVVKK